MSRRARWAWAIVLPVFLGVLFGVRALWLAHVATLNEGDLHLQVFDHATAIAGTLWMLIIVLTAGITWWSSGFLAARATGRPNVSGQSNDR